MCGFAGIIDRHSTPTADLLRRAAGAIAHRGPDSEGIYAEDSVGFAHRRLSIIDLSERGSQPMHSDDRSLTIAYNGEIYNFKELSAALKDQRPFRGTSDTEVILRCFEEQAPDCVRAFNGIFTLALYDRRSSEVILARDQWGIKPLYYAEQDGRFYFASEIKCMLAMGLKTAPDDLAVLDDVFTGWTADHRTLFQGVKRLPPGSILRYNLKTHTFTVSKYFSAVPAWDRAAPLGDDPSRWADAINDELTRAIRMQLLSDVPVGTFCSGGLDSSLVTAIAAKMHPGVHAFNVASPDTPEVDEGPYAVRLAKDLGVNLHQLSLTREMFREALVRTVRFLEMPLMVVNAVPLHLLSELARREGMTVLLSGEGADETFGGYVNLYRPNALQRVVRSRGKVIGAMTARGIDLVERIGRRIGMSSREKVHVPTVHDLFTGAFRLWTTREDAAPLYSRYADPLDRELASELHSELGTYLPPLLHRADRASMGASIELRVPFLDIDLVALGLAAPPTLKVGIDGVRPFGKKLLKEIAVRHIPREIAYRSKMGFTVPPSYYLGPWPESWMKEGFITSHFAITRKDLDSWIRAQNYQSACWMLTLEIWGQLFFRSRSVEEIAAEFLAAPTHTHAS